EHFSRALVGVLDMPEDLAARPALLVEQGDRKPQRTAAQRRLHAGRAGADDQHVRAVRHGAVPSVMLARRAAPSCVLIRMPSRTSIRQLWELATPSISSRHSKHTPIMHSGALGAPLTGVRRKRTAPCS